MTTEPEAVRLAREVVASGYIHDSGPRIDVLARAVLDQHAEIERLRKVYEAAKRWHATGAENCDAGGYPGIERDKCPRCQTSDGCPKHRRFRCVGCKRVVSWSKGSSDDMPNHCDDCWHWRHVGRHRARRGAV